MKKKIYGREISIEPGLSPDKVIVRGARPGERPPATSIRLDDSDLAGDILDRLALKRGGWHAQLAWNPHDEDDLSWELKIHGVHHLLIYHIIREMSSPRNKTVIRRRR